MATTVLQVRIDENLKNEAQVLFDNLGLDIPTAIRIFLKKAVNEKGIPFDLKDKEKIEKIEFQNEEMSDGLKAFMKLREEAQRNGTAGMSLKEINAEIKAARAERHAREAKQTRTRKKAS